MMMSAPSPRSPGDMDERQIRELLALACTFDGRKPNKSEVLAWGLALRGCRPQECADAIAAYYADPALSERRQRGEMTHIQVADVRARVLLGRRARREEQKRTRLRLPYSDNDNPDGRAPHDYAASHQGYLAASAALAAARAARVSSPEQPTHGGGDEDQDRRTAGH